jgi:Na+(H+)/acetate symporter ActP
MGVMVGSAVPPIAFCITWNKISAAGAVSGALTGLVGAIITWICTAKVSGKSCQGPGQQKDVMGGFWRLAKGFSKQPTVMQARQGSPASGWMGCRTTHSGTVSLLPVLLTVSPVAPACLLSYPPYQGLTDPVTIDTLGEDFHTL